MNLVFRKRLSVAQTDEQNRIVPGYLSVALCRLSFPGYAGLPERKQSYSRIRILS
jgi:hypothetical protein